MRTETSTTFGLRHMPSGKLVQLRAESNIGQDCCGDESCTLTLDGYGSEIRFQVDTFYDLLIVLTRNEQWYNSSRERPMWGRVNLSECSPVAFVKELGFDSIGGDPVSSTEKTIMLRLPAFVAGTVLPTQQPKNTTDFVKIFGPVGDIDDDAWPFVSIVKLEGTEIEHGMLLDNPMQGKGLVVAVAPVPPRWPVDRGRPFDRADPDYRLVLCHSGALRQEGVPSEFVAEEEQAAVPGMR